MPLVTVAVTLVPCLLIFFYIYTHDEHPEPKGLITKVAVFGALAAIPVLMAVSAIKAFGVPDDPILGSFMIAFLWAAIPEEFFKMIMVYEVAYKRPEFDEPMDGVIYGAASSLGFALLENVLYVSQLGLETAIMRAFTAIPMHLFCGVTMGYFIGRAKFRPEGKGNAGLWFLAFLIPMLIHGIYDAMIFAAQAAYEPLFLIPGAASLIFVVVLGIILMNRLEKRNLAILSAHHGIPEEELQRHLPKGTLTEAKLPQILEFFKEAAASGGTWAVPADFHERIKERFGTPPEAPTQPAVSGKRGFLGFLFSFFGILVAGFGGIFAIWAWAGFSGELDKPVPDAAIWVGVGLSVFLLVNGVMLYLKGLYRNRRERPVRSVGIQFLMFLSALVSVFAALGAIGLYEKQLAKEPDADPMNALIVAAVAGGFWIIATLWPRRKPAPAQAREA